MTAKEKVMNEYPLAFALIGKRHVQIWSPDSLLGASMHRESWAWADAWRRIQQRNSGKKE